MSNLIDKFNEQMNEMSKSFESGETVETKVEEVKPEVQEETVEVKTESQEVVENKAESSDPYLEEALKMGFNPSYQGPNKKSAEQFVKDGSFFRKIDAQNKKIDELTDLVKKSFEHNRNLEKATYEKALKDLQEQKRQAVADGDVEKFELVEQEEKIVAKQIEKTVPEVKPEFVLTPDLKDFYERNKEWCNNTTPANQRLVAAADGLDRLLAAEDAEQGIVRSQAEHLKRVEENLKSLDIYKQRFKNENKEKPIAVSKSTVSSGSPPKSLANRLSAEQKAFLESAREYDPSISLEEFAKQLDVMGQLKHD